MPTRSKITVTTTDTIEGFRVKEYLGVVRGTAEDEINEAVKDERKFRSSVFISDLGEESADPGEELDGFPRSSKKRGEWTRACDLMTNQARKMGANAVIGATYICCPNVGGNENWTGTSIVIVCYGTAVVIEPA